MNSDAEIKYEFLMNEIKRLLASIADHPLCPIEVSKEIKLSEIYEGSAHRQENG